jgi:hypothetical protein
VAASATLASVADVFPVSTSVGAYLAKYRRDGAPPSGTATDTATVASTGSLAFDALAHDEDYVAYASVSGVHKYKAFSTDRPRTRPVDVIGERTQDCVPTYDSTSEQYVNTPTTPRDRQVFNVLDYIPATADMDAVLAGTTEIGEYVQDACDAAGAAGGGDVLFSRPGRYLLEQTGTNAGQNWSVACGHDNVRFVFVDGAIVTTADDCAPFFFSGSIKPAGAADWDDYWLGRAANATYYAISDITAGDQQITFTTASHAGNFDKGDYIYVRTGNLTALSPNTEPLAEILTVAADGDTNTGVVLVEGAIKHSYSQEYFISGTSGKTSTSVTANLATFGAANVTDRIVKNVGLVNYQIDSTAARYGFMAWGVDGIEILGMRGSLPGSPMNAIEWRGMFARDFDVTISNTASASARWLFTVATGCTRGRFYNMNGRAAGGRAMFAHVHEGGTDIEIDGLYIDTVAGDDSANLTPLSIRGRGSCNARNIVIVSGGTGSPVYVSEECPDGGLIENVRAKCATAEKGVAINSAGWRVRNPHPTTTVRYSGLARVPGVPTGETRWLIGLVRYDGANPTLGTMPVNSMIVDSPRVYVDAAFTDTGTDLLTIGWDSNADAVVESLDVSSTGAKTLVLGDNVGVRQTVARTVEAYYTGQNGNAGAGKATIVIPFVICTELT